MICEKIETARYAIYCADCLDVMPTLAAASVQAVITDLPYGTTACHWDTVIPFGELWSNYKRLTKENSAVVLTSTQPFTSSLICSNLEWFKYCWVWEKSLLGGFHNAKHRPLKAHEDICVFSGAPATNCNGAKMLYNPQNVQRCGKTRKNKFNPKDGIYGQRPSRPNKGEYVQEFTNYPATVLSIPNERGCHSTQKPVSLMEYLVQTYTNRDDVVLDSTMGSGTTGVACLNTGRKFIGIEIDPKYFALAASRLAECSEEPPLFKVNASAQLDLAFSPSNI